MSGYLGQQFGNYRLIKLIGQGGFADVYLGEHIHLNTQAAIKILQTRLVGNNLEQFRNEARTIARLSHPNIVRVLDFGVEENIPYLVMEYAPNGTLRQRHPKGIPLSPLSIVPYLQQSADALQFAHDMKLIHRDIKPENMLLGTNNQVLLSDFGLVLIAQSTGSRSTKEMGGTVPYMAPEQLQGRSRPASDQYALGIVVYEWLSGDRPFNGTFTEIVSQHMFVPPPPLSSRILGISPEIEQVVLTALSKDPQRRYSSIKAFATAFEQTCQVLPNYPHPITYSTIQMDQFASSTYVIQPGPATFSTRLTPNLSETSQSTIVNNLVEKKRQPGAMNTPQIQSAFPTNVVQQSTSPRPSLTISTPTQFSKSSNSNGMQYVTSPPMAPHIATKGAGLPPSDPRRRKGKLLIFTAACMLIIAIIALLPLLPGLSSNASKSSIASGSETHLTTTSTLPTPTSTSLPKATSAAASNPNAASTPSQTPTALPTLTPTTPTTTPPSGPGVTIANLTPSQCSTTNQGWTCTETLSEDQNNTSNLSWSASTGTAGVSFNPSSSTLSPGKTSQVNIAIPLSDCSDTFTFKGPIDSSNVTWNCALPAPTQLSPASGTVFNNYPRTTTLQWSAVPGAASYTVQIYYYQPGDTICSGGAQDYLTPNITNTSYTFEFVGAQPGCWRVWAVDAAGRQSSISGWWEFSYTV
jgi:serine/threonine protein kinase